MASSQAVYIKSGDQPRAFIFGNQVVPQTGTTTVQVSLPIYKESVFSSFQAIVQGTGTVSATVALQVTNDDNTGRGFILNNMNAPGSLVTTNATTVLTSQGNNFTQALINSTVSVPGVPVGTTVVSVAASGVSLVMSASATTSATVQGLFFANNWCATAMGTITLTGTNSNSDGFVTSAPWRYVRGNVTAITGTSAVVTILMGV